MRQSYLLAVVLVFGLGCAAEGEKAQWDEFWKDVRGDNSKMRWDSLGRMDKPDGPTLRKSRD